ncbi:type II toxin-antitoxin system YafQ family toxin [Helicobacter pylori]|uniref:type II toxin-antitoxin system RelE/ParE family toxin n=1 Tax=Helicobacter pylori TaxID=210 RepID=UPI002FBEA84A
MPNTTNKDYTKYSQKQLFNFLNSIKTKQKRALEKLKEIQIQKQMLTIETSKKFDKDLKILVKNGFDLKLLYKVVGNLAKEQSLAPKYKDHPLKGAL